MAILHTRVEDGSCCGKMLDCAISAGDVDDLDAWTCSDCGCIWIAKMVGPIKHWEPFPYVAVIR